MNSHHKQFWNFSAVYTKENRISYDTRFITANATFSQLTCQFSKETILDKLSPLNIYKFPGSDSFHPRVLHELRYELCEPLYSLFSTSYSSVKLYTSRLENW